MKMMMSYRSPTKYVDKEAPTSWEIITQLRNIDGVRYRSIMLETSQSRLWVFAIVELLGEDIYDLEFKVNHLAISYQTSLGNWYLVNPNMYFDEEEKETSYILGNGQWDPAQTCEAIPRHTAEDIMTTFGSRSFAPDNEIWMRRSYSKLTLTHVSMCLYENSQRLIINSPSDDIVQFHIDSLNGVDKYRIVFRVDSTYLFIHITEDVNRVVLSFFQRDQDGYLRRDRLVERTKNIADTPTRVLFSSGSNDIVPFYETITKETAIEATIKLLHNGVFINESNDTWMSVDWWSVKWRL